jgi:hypothetical protein
MKLYLTLIIAVFTAIVAGCEHKVEPIPVGELNQYRDPAFGFRIVYPGNWKQLGVAGQAVFTSSQDVLNKFLDPRSGIEGAAVFVDVSPYAGRPAASFIDSSKTLMNETYKGVINLDPDEPITVDGKQSTKVPYKIQATTKNFIYGYMIFVPGDTAMYKLEFKGYGGQFDAHAAVFDTMLKSFKLPVVVAKGPSVWQPSSILETYNSAFFSLKYPDNLNIADVKKGPKDDLAMEMRADRLDCSFHTDVFGAESLSVEKVWNQNKGRYHARSSGDTKIDGQPAVWADYSPRKDISSRVYFVVKNNKVIRITINYYSPQKEVYFPAFENMVKSMNLK